MITCLQKASEVPSLNNTWHTDIGLIYLAGLDLMIVELWHEGKYEISLQTHHKTPPDTTLEELRSLEIIVLWETTSSTTASSSKKELHPLAPLHGLGVCTTMQPSNPLPFVMQTIVLALASLLLSSVIGPLLLYFFSARVKERILMVGGRWC